MGSPRLKSFGNNVLRIQDNQKDVGETTVFAYLRKSTDKEEQRDSITQQEEGIVRIAKELGINLHKIRNFTETKSGFENRKRYEWRKMLQEIDRLKTPCILLARDTSRLSRNPTDNLAIANRLFGDNKTRKTIGKIFFLGDGAMIQEWSERSDKKYIVDKLHQNYIESIETKTKSVNGHILKLETGVYPYTAPKGLQHIVQGGKRILRQNEKMPFIRKACEMKVAGIVHTEISKYLRDVADIKISPRELSARIFCNTVYIGEYTEKNTGMHFDGLLFLEGTPPISAKLWADLQRNKGRKRGNYGEKQANFVLGDILKTEQGRKFSGYIQKGTTQYKNTREGINVSEKWITSEYLKMLKIIIVNRILESYFEDAVKSGEIAAENLGFWIDIGTKFFSETADDNSLYSQIKQDFLLGDGVKLTPEESLNIEQEIYHAGEELGAKPEESLAVIKTLFGVLFGLSTKSGELFVDYIHTISSLFEESTRDMQSQQRNRLMKLERAKERIQEDDKQAKRGFLNSGGMESLLDVLNEGIEDRKQQIRMIDEEISEIQSESDFDGFCRKIPGILQRTFELSEKVLTEKENEHLKENVFDLIKLTTVELKIKKKKALEIELFGPVKQVLFGRNVGMEAPAGVEPASRALQAPVGPFYQGAK